MLDTANCLLYNDYTPYIDVRCKTFIKKVEKIFLIIYCAHK